MRQLCCLEYSMHLFEYEYCIYGTYGEHYELDINTEVVIKHIMEDYEKWKKNKEVK